MPFLPGDSLLFVAGTLAGSGLLNIWAVYFTLLIAAIVGDTVNYWLGRRIGHRVFLKENSRLFNRAYLEKTHKFYERYGGKTIILARFLPIIRTFAPFVAGIGKMRYNTFLAYNVAGAFIWVTSITFLGYFFGGLYIIQENFEYAIMGIIFVSLVPVAVEYIRHKLRPKVAKKQLKPVSSTDIQKTLKKEHVSD